MILSILAGADNVVVFMEACQETLVLGLNKMRIDRRDLKKIPTQHCGSR
jgi:hypothetical protein